MLRYESSITDDIASIPPEMARLQDQTGVQVDGLTKQMEHLTSKMAVLCEDQYNLVDVMEEKVVSLKPFIPLNSREGMELLFKVSYV